jgi:Cu-Zn family superoxide dismutase
MRLLAPLALVSLMPFAAAADVAAGAIFDSDGAEIGTIRIVDQPSGFASITIEASGFDEGVMGVHLHETGACDAPDFSSAGGHIAGDAMHGVSVEGGPHPGDLPNAHVGSDGMIAVEYFTDRIAVADLLDDDGSAFIVHSAADDYESQPSGDAGDRLACAVIEAAES